MKSWFKHSLLDTADDFYDARDQGRRLGTPLYKVPEWVRPWTAAVAKVGTYLKVVGVGGVVGNIHYCRTRSTVDVKGATE